MSANSSSCYPSRRVNATVAAIHPLTENVFAYVRTEFDENDDMTSCLVLLQDTNPPTVCNRCKPCRAGQGWGMEFSCFAGGWDSQSLCVSGSRVGHIPTFPIIVDDSREDNNDEFLLALVIGLAAGVVFALLLSLFTLLCCCRTPVDPPEHERAAMIPVASTKDPCTVPPEAAVPRKEGQSLGQQVDL